MTTLWDLIQWISRQIGSNLCFVKSYSSESGVLVDASYDLFLKASIDDFRNFISTSLGYLLFNLGFHSSFNGISFSQKWDLK